MYIFKNAIQNLGRNKGRNIILGIIMVCLLAVASVSISIDSTTNKIKQSYKDMYGSEVFVQPDFNKLTEKADKDGNFEFPVMKPSDYQKLMDSEYIKETKVIYSIGMRSSSTKYVEEKNDKGNNNSQIVGGSTIIGNAGEGEVVEPHFNLLAYSDLKYLKDFEEGKRTMTSGEMFKNDNEAIISEDYAKLNDLVVGSTFKLNSSDKDTEIELTVAGIYRDQKESSFGMIFGPYTNPKNEIIVSEQTVNNLKLDESMWSNATYTFYLKNPDLLDAFNKEAHDKGISEYLNMTTDEMTYNQMVTPIEGIAQTSMMFLLVFLGFGCGLLVLLSILSVRERKYEVGVLRAIGMKKSQVMRTLIYESMLTMVICLFLGLGIGAIASKPVSAMMLDNQKSNQQSMSFSFNVGSEQKEIVTEDVQMSKDAVMKVSVVGLLIALISTSVGIIYVLRYEPMEILVERN